MSEANVEIARLAYERFNSGDVDGFTELCTILGSRGSALRDRPGQYIERSASRLAC